MSVIDRLASTRGRNDEVPNQELAQDIIETEDQGSIEELIGLLSVNSDPIRNDSIKTLYEIGYIKPQLISRFVKEFLYQLKSPVNRMVWGAMTALSTIAGLEADTIFPYLDDILMTIEEGSVITVDSGIKVLAGVAAGNAEYQERIVPYLIKHLLTCRAKEVPQHAEQSLKAISGEYRESFQEALEARKPELTEPQLKRLDRVLRILASR